MNRPHRILWALWALLASILVSAGSWGALGAQARVAEAASQDRWYVIKIAGNAAGYVHEKVEAKAKAGPRLLVTTSDMRLVLNRLGSRIELRFLSSAEESTEGMLARTSYVMLASNQSTKSDAVIKDGKIELSNEAGGKTYTHTLTFAGALYGPEGIRRMSAAGLNKTGDKVTVQTFVPEATLVAKLTRVLLGKENIEIEGQSVAAIKVEETLEGMPVKRTGWLDEQGNLLRQEEPGPFGIMEVVRADRAAAMAAASGAELPAEIYEKSIVRTNIRVSRAQPVDRLKLRLTHRNPALGWPELKTANQTVVEKSVKELVLEIRRPQPPKGAAFPVGVTAENRQYLEANAYIQSDDAEIRKLARELAAGETDALKATLVMERWVAEHMTFDLGIVFAPATEVFRNRRGTCVGYATLLATLARAAGIPSRVNMGYVYAQGMFGGHAWAEILAGKEWIPVDAAVVNEGAADATHLEVVSSSLANGPGEMSLGPAQQVFGQVDIAIQEFETGRKVTVVPADAKPFIVEGDRYQNPWLGLALTKPADFRFSKLDAIWPDPTVAGLAGADGAKAMVEEREIYPWQDPQKAVKELLAKIVQGGRSEVLRVGEAGKSIPVIYAADGKTAAAAFVRGLEVLVLRAEAKDAASLLGVLAQNLELAPR